MPEMVARFGETFAKALDLLEVEKNAILGKYLLLFIALLHLVC